MSFVAHRCQEPTEGLGIEKFSTAVLGVVQWKSEIRDPISEFK